MPDVDLTALAVPGSVSDWAGIGFDATGVGFGVGAVWTHIDTAPGWAFSRAGGERLPVAAETQKGPAGRAEHPNSTTKIDHVVLTVPSLEDAIGSFLSAFGLEPKKVGSPRPDSKMAFFRCGEALVEVVEGDGPALWGVVFRVGSMDDCIKACGDRLGEPKPAIQGGTIATVTDGGVAGYRVAFLER